MCIQSVHWHEMSNSREQRTDPTYVRNNMPQRLAAMLRSPRIRAPGVRVLAYFHWPNIIWLKFTPYINIHFNLR